MTKMIRQIPNLKIQIMFMTEIPNPILNFFRILDLEFRFPARRFALAGGYLEIGALKLDIICNLVLGNWRFKS